MTYFGNTLTDLQSAQSGTERVNAQRAIASEQAATQLAIQKIVSAIEQQKANQQGQYQQGSLGVQNRQVDAGEREALLRTLFNQQEVTSQINENALDRALREKQIMAQFPGEASRIGEQRLKNEQAERDAMRLIEEQNNKATAAASRYNSLLEANFNAALQTQEKAKADEWFTSKAGAKKEFDAKRAKGMKPSEFPTELKTVLESWKSDPDAGLIDFDGSRFIPKTMRFSPPTTGTGTNAALQQLFGTGTQTATQPAPVAPQYFSTDVAPARPRLDPQVVLLEAKLAIEGGKDPKAVRRAVIEMGITPDF